MTSHRAVPAPAPEIHLGRQHFDHFGLKHLARQSAEEQLGLDATGLGGLIDSVKPQYCLFGLLQAGLQPGDFCLIRSRIDPEQPLALF